MFRNELYVKALLEYSISNIRKNPSISVLTSAIADKKSGKYETFKSYLSNLIKKCEATKVNQAEVDFLAYRAIGTM